MRDGIAYRPSYLPFFFLLISVVRLFSFLGYLTRTVDLYIYVSFSASNALSTLVLPSLLIQHISFFSGAYIESFVQYYFVDSCIDVLLFCPHCFYFHEVHQKYILFQFLYDLLGSCGSVLINLLDCHQILCLN